jgi:transposase
MTTWHTREELCLQVALLLDQGVSRRATARALGISRNTLKRIVRDRARAQEQGQLALAAPPQRAPRLRRIDAFAPRVQALLVTYPDITAQRVFEILRDEKFEGGYTAVKEHLRRVRPKRKPTPSFETPSFGPGQMAECDWSPYDVKLTSGETATIQLFGYTLVFSRRKYFAAFAHADLHSLMDGHIEAFHRFDGFAESCKYDSQKPVVLRWEGAQAIYNPRYLAFATHYGIRPCAVRGNPNAKPRVERSFWEHERSFLNGRSFRTIDDFKVQLADWLDRVVDPRRRHGTSAIDRFQEEAGHLRKLPGHPYDTARVTHRLCSIDGYVDWEGNRYAVPYEHVTDILPLRVTQRELFIYGPNITCIAQYELLPRGRGERFDPLGLHTRAEKRQAAIALEQLERAFGAMGENAAAFFTSLGSQSVRIWPHQARQILQLRARYCTEHVDAALGHALRYGALDAQAVERILANRHPLRTFDEYVAQETAAKLDTLLGESVTRVRDLTEYDAMPTVGSIDPAKEAPT